MNDHYALLGVARGADAREIQKAYRGRAKGCHPDLHPGDAGAEEAFKALSEAYAVLNDPGERAAYDRLNPLAGQPRPREPVRPASAAPWSNYGRGRENWIPIDMAAILADRERRVRDILIGRIIGIACLAGASVLILFYSPHAAFGLTYTASLPSRLLLLFGLYFILFRPRLLRGY